MNRMYIPSGGEWAIVSLILLVLFVVPVIFYLLTLQNTLKAISPENRRMTPGYVWLLLIPLFGMVWHFVAVAKLSDSIRAELFKRNITTGEARPVYNIGFAMCILGCIVLFPMSVVKSVCSLALLICWIIFWVKVNQYKNSFLRSH